MYETQMILTRGFANVYRDGQPVGFQLQVKIAYYRGIFLSIIGGLDIAVDGVKYSRDQLRLTCMPRTSIRSLISTSEGIATCRLQSR